MALALRTKLTLQKEATSIKQLLNAGGLALREKLAKQKRWTEILKQLNGKVDDNGNNIDAEAAKAATANDGTPEPSEAQKLAGNYKKGKVTIAGMDIRIENPKGSTRSGTSKNGDKWSITLNHHYGDFAGTKGADGDPVDVFIGESGVFDKVYIVDQVGLKGEFDEHKVMLGFDSMAQAKAAYLSNYKKGWDGLGDITAMPLDKFKAWVNAGVKNKPVGSLDSITVSFIDEYVAGKFFSLEPPAFKELVLQADEEGLSLDENKNVVIEYIKTNKSKFDLTELETAA